MKRIAFSRLLLALCLGVPGSYSLAADEAIVKTGYLYNFTKFVQWPDEQRAMLRLCAFGDDTLGKSLDSLIGKPVRSMRIGVRHMVELQDIPQCDLVFIPMSHAQSLERVRQVVNGYPILVVAESSDVLPKGAIVALIQSNDRIIFEVDLSTARQHGMQVSGKMLQLARRVF